MSIVNFRGNDRTFNSPCPRGKGVAVILADDNVVLQVKMLPEYDCTQLPIRPAINNPLLGSRVYLTEGVDYC